jgi:hypothetical protein
LIVATHGRAFWVLDDITPLRQLSAAVVDSSARLFRPAPAIRERQSENHDTPLPPEIPHGDNPPTGAILDYWLRTVPTGPITLDILDARGTVVRHFASDQPTDTVRAFVPASPPYFMTQWLPHLESLTANAGHNRFVWDLRMARPSAESYGYSSNVVPGRGAEAEPGGPLVVPGSYRVRLTVGGTSETQPLRVLMDPRERVEPAALEAQFALAMQISNAMGDAAALQRTVHHLRDSLAAQPSESDTVSRMFDSLHIDATAEGLTALESAVDGADRAPTAPMQSVFAGLRSELADQRRAVSRLHAP